MAGLFWHCPSDLSDFVKPMNLVFHRAFLCLAALVLIRVVDVRAQDETGLVRTYFVDSVAGKDFHDGRSVATAWQSLSRVQATRLSPGDTLRFKRGSRFETALRITDSGNVEHPIVLTDYGDADDDPPAFTNGQFNPEGGQFGNCIRLQGDFIVVENLYFYQTVAALSGRIGFATMWELGALYIDKSAAHCVVRDNEFFDCGVGIKSYGAGAVIRNNYLHDCNRILKEWNWGPIGIWLGADDQEVCYNRIINYRAVDPRINWGPNGYGGGADGSAIEIDDARVDKSRISIHHNYSRDNQGFLEVTWSDLARHPSYQGFMIHHNVSDDFQQFVALWRGAACRIENNTIVRRKVNANDWGVFNLTQNNSTNRIRNNVVVVEQGVVVFNLGKDGTAQPNTVIENNLYFAASGKLDMGLEGPGVGARFGDPMFVNYAGGNSAVDFALTASSPAINRGLDLGYQADFRDVPIPQDGAPDLGAFEYSLDNGQEP